MFILDLPVLISRSVDQIFTQSLIDRTIYQVSSQMDQLYSLKAILKCVFFIPDSCRGLTAELMPLPKRWI